jgi:hypothetical protein
MPTDVTVSNDKQRSAMDREAANLVATLLLIPLIACLGSILLSIVSAEFADTMVAAATR